MAHRPILSRHPLSMSTRWRQILAGAAIFVLAAPNTLAVPRLAPPNKSSAIYTDAVRLYPVGHEPQRLGALTFMEGWALQSPRSAFGGFSSLTLLGPRHFRLLSDKGEVVSFHLAQDGSVRDPMFRRIAVGIRRRGGGPFHASDAEAMTAAPDGRSWISFEAANAIARYDPTLAYTQGIARPTSMRGWDVNLGAEAMERLRDGRIIVLSEGSGDDARGSDAAMFHLDPLDVPAGHRFYYHGQQFGRITELRELPNGKWLILHRSASPWRGFRTQLVLADAAGLQPGGVLQGRVIAQIAPPALTENFEGMAIEPPTADDPATYVWLVSDNNLMAFQTSYLLRFRIDDGVLGAPLPAAKPPRPTPSQKTGRTGAP